MKVEVINTGTELLLGEILNTNFQYLSRQLNKLGFDVLYQTTVGDNAGRLKDVFKNALERADIIITTGGLGPTRGDITKEVLCETLNLGTYLDLDTWNRINNYFCKRGLCMSGNNEKQAMIPVGAEILTNEVGTAPGLAIRHEGKLIVLLPGPPSEMQHVYEKQLEPFLINHFTKQGIIYSHIIRLRGIGESAVAEKLDDIITSQTNPTIAIYARRGEIIIRITAKCMEVNEAKTLIAAMEALVNTRLKQYIYGTDDETLASYLGKELLRTESTISFAESCTGGLASSLVTDVPGSSEYLLGSAVTYSNMAKHKLINVSEESLEAYGAVSWQVACEMAQGVRELFSTTYGVGITGIAGPGGATEDKPVGLVYMAVADADGVKWAKHIFGGTRTDNKMRSALTAISMVIDRIKEKETENKDK